MARRKASREFAEASGKTIRSIKYEENVGWQALVITCTDGEVFSFEFSARVTVQASYLKAHKGNLKLIRNFGRVSGDSAHQA